MNKYFEKLNNNLFHPDIIKLETYALEHKVPIIMKDSLIVILNLISIIKPKRILEIGTAIAYSSICMAYQNDCIIDTIERDEEMYHHAMDNIKMFDLTSRINVINQDALLLDTSMLETYDLIFIDAAKAQNIKFFEKFVPLLNENGLIITDNLLFHGAVEHQETLTKNVKKMVNKIDEYNNYLLSLPNYQTHFIDTGDGIAITKKVKL